jgi:hypothetical protein
MARRGKKNKRSVITRWREWREEQRASGAARRWRWGFATVALIAGAIGVGYGMHALERDVLRAQSARGPARITFVQRPRRDGAGDAVRPRPFCRRALVEPDHLR